MHAHIHASIPALEEEVTSQNGEAGKPDDDGDADEPRASQEACSQVPCQHWVSGSGFGIAGLRADACELTL